jgi:hypothetical protein
MKPTYKMNRSLHCLSVMAALVLAQPALAAVIFTQSTMDTTAAGTGAEILNNGTLVEANHFGTAPITLAAAGPVTLDNGLTFGNSTSSFTIGGPQNATNTDAKNFTPAVTNAAFNAFADTYIWIAYSGSVSTITIPGLTVGQEYRLQMISFGSSNAGINVEGDGAVWSNSNSLFTADWVAADTQADIVITRIGDEVNFNGYALHAIPEPSAALLGGLGALALLRRRRNG